ncbi:MAG: hypothetical protein R3B84_18820 [Zavarzinella sp.]
MGIRCRWLVGEGNRSAFQRKKSYEYDSLSHRSAYVDRLDRRTEYAYDAVGQLLTET